MITKTYNFKAKLWLWEGKGAWHFLTLPERESAEIKEIYGVFTTGWGSVPVTVTIGKSVWKTSIFPSKKEKAYLLPIKGEIRKNEKLQVSEVVEYSLEIK